MQSKPPLNIIQFASIENEQLLVSIANNNEELAIISHIQGLYEAALQQKEIGVNDAVVFQLLVFIHYHFLFSNLCLMRCHLSEAFASARAAIDAALIAAVIISDRSKQVEYATKKHPFDGSLNRYLKNLIKDNKPLPHSNVPTLLDLYGKYSSFASHADIGSFAHRTILDTRNPHQESISIEYFQFSRNKTERQIHSYTLLHLYIILLDVFAPFLVLEKKLLSEAWHVQLQKLGGFIEVEAKKLNAQLASDKENTDSASVNPA